MNDRLWTFLKACDRDRCPDLAVQALTLAITRVMTPGGEPPQLLDRCISMALPPSRKSVAGMTSRDRTGGLWQNSSMP